MKSPVWPRPSPEHSRWVVEPYLHVDKDRIYNPVTDRTLLPEDAHFATVKRLCAGRIPIGYPKRTERI